MSENLFKNHTPAAIEACIAKALGALLGEEVKVCIDGLRFADAGPRAAEFGVHARHAMPEDFKDVPF